MPLPAGAGAPAETMTQTGGETNNRVLAGCGRTRFPRRPVSLSRQVPRAARPFGELVGVVGDQLGSIPRPRDRDMECALVDQVRILRRHRREDPVDLAAQEGVNRGREGALVGGCLPGCFFPVAKKICELN